MKFFSLKKFIKLNSSGFSHIILPLVVIAAVAGIGTYLLIASHADTTTCGSAYQARPTNHGTTGGDSLGICPIINTNSTHHTGTVSAQLTYMTYINDKPVSAAVILYQCGPTGSPCAAISAAGGVPALTSVGAVSGVVYHTYVLSVPIKAFSFGHSYKACANLKDSTGWSPSAICSPAQIAGQTYKGF